LDTLEQQLDIKEISKKVHELLGGIFYQDFIKVYRYWERYDMQKKIAKAGNGYHRLEEL
jgi:hypothetical protein